MNIIEHELKRYDLWQEELQKKKKAYILLLRVIQLQNQLNNIVDVCIESIDMSFV